MWLDLSQKAQDISLMRLDNRTFEIKFIPDYLPHPSLLALVSLLLVLHAVDAFSGENNRVMVLI